MSLHFHADGVELIRSLVHGSVKPSGGTVVGTGAFTFQSFRAGDPTAVDLLPLFRKGTVLEWWYESGGIVQFRYFVGVVTNVEIIGGATDSIHELQLVVEAQDTNYILDTVWVRDTPRIIGAGTMATQTHALCVALLGGAARAVDSSTFQENILPSTILPALTFQNQSLRQCLGAILAQVQRVDPTIQPRFHISAPQSLYWSYFGDPALYIYDAQEGGDRRSGAPISYTLTTATALAPGEYRLYDEWRYRIDGSPPFCNDATVVNIGGLAITAIDTASQADAPNPYSPANTYATVIRDNPNGDVLLPDEARRQATTHSKVRKILTGSCLVPLIPGNLGTFRIPALAGADSEFAQGKSLIIIDSSINWDRPVKPQRIDGNLVLPPVLVAFTAADRAHELGDDTENGPDLTQLPALNPSVPARNILKTQEPGIKILRFQGQADATDRTWYDDNGVHHPLGVIMEFSSDTPKKWKPIAACVGVAVAGLERSGSPDATLSFAVDYGDGDGPVAVTPPFDTPAGATITVTPSGVDSSDSLTLTVREQDQATVVLA